VSGPVSCLDPVQLQRDLWVRDLSDPAEGRHAIQIRSQRSAPSGKARVTAAVRLDTWSLS
jgi:hypothetical protein